MRTNGGDWKELSNVELPPEHWWNIASLFPIDAYQSPLFGLMVLEAPERWQTVGRRWGTLTEAKGFWVDNYMISRCKDRTGEFAIVCAYRAWHALQEIKTATGGDYYLAYASKVLWDAIQTAEGTAPRKIIEVDNLGRYAEVARLAQNLLERPIHVPEMVRGVITPHAKHAAEVDWQWRRVLSFMGVTDTLFPEH